MSRRFSNGGRSLVGMLVCAAALSGCDPAFLESLEQHHHGDGHGSAGTPAAGSGGSAAVDAGTPADQDAGVACGSRGLPACPMGQFCNFPAEAACGEGDMPGTCEVIPQLCPQIYMPVCGCDNQTHPNSCQAASAGTSVRAFGACPGTAGQTCGGLLGAQCQKGSYCDFPIEARCGAADATGTCASVPQVCTDLFDPVCGCDGKTYSNACRAATAGSSVASQGACPNADGGV